MTTDFLLDAYDYPLPPALIAQAPVPNRCGSRLLVLDRSRNGGLEHRIFSELGRYLDRGDVLVLNDTRVVPSRLRGVKASGGKVELLVLEPCRSEALNAAAGHPCLIKASKPPRAGTRLILNGGVTARVEAPLGEGRYRVRFDDQRPLAALLDAVGEVPLPPYISRTGSDPAPVNDRDSYQTVYADHPGAVAAPTAGLHFTRQLLDQLERQGVELVRITLHVGYGTFAPIRCRDIRDHRMHAEAVEISAAAAAVVNTARRDGRRIVAVGTTAVRTLEWSATDSGTVTAGAGLCDHYIYPGYRFRVVDAMITNFHLPKSTLLLLVSALAGREAILAAYREAITRGYRFYSYGDAMLIR